MASNGLLNFQGTNKATFVGATSNIALDVVNSSLGIGITGTDPPSSNLYITGNAYVTSDISVGGVLNMGVVNVAARHTLEAITSLGASTPSTLTLTNTGTSLVASGEVKGGYDTNTTSYFGRAAVGYCGHNDAMAICHIDSNNNGGYALLQETNGETMLNSASGQSVHIRQGNVDKLVINSSGNVGVDTMNPYSMLHLGSDTAPSGGRAKSGNMTASDYYLLLGRAEHGVEKEWRIGFGYNTSATNVPPSYIGFHERVNSSGTKGDLVFGGRHTDNAGIQATERMRITYDGCVGIRNTTPDCPLHVSGYGGTNTGATYHSGFIHGQESLHRWTNNHSNVGIFADDDIMSHGYILSINGTFGASDRRIKKDIVDIDDGAALQILRQLQPKQYKYIDTYRKTSDPVWGFIAQEVRETLPHSTQFRTEFIPDITEVATVSESTVLTFTNFDTSNLEIGKKLRVHDQNHAEHKIKVASIIDAHSVRVEEDLSGWTCSFNEDGTIGEGNSLYVFGREVDDFVFLKKDAIWTVATAALQEVDRQLQAEKEKVRMLEDHLTRFTVQVTARLAALESQK
jgi:hypothetical protein